MYLYANGCSMTYGSELVDDSQTNVCLDHNERQKLAWPGQLTTLLNFDGHFNDGKAGGSNERMFRTTFEWISEYLNCGKDPENLFVVIGWTCPTRYEIKFKNQWTDIRPPHLALSYKDPTLKKITNFYGKYITDIETDYIKTFTYMLSVKSLLEANGIPYYFFSALHMFHNDYTSLQNLKLQIDQNRYYNFEDDHNNCMFAVCTHNNLPIGPKLHPLKQGHQYWAQLLAEQITEKNLLKYA